MVQWHHPVLNFTLRFRQQWKLQKTLGSKNFVGENISPYGWLTQNMSIGHFEQFPKVLVFLAKLQLKTSVSNFYQNFNIHILRYGFLYIHDEQVHRLASSPQLFLRPGYPCFFYEYSDFPQDGQEWFSA